MCKGLGLDLCGISRMEALLRDERFLNRYFTPAETAYVHAKGAGAAQTLAGLYAAKEAVLKAMGVGIALPLPGSGNFSRFRRTAAGPPHRARGATAGRHGRRKLFAHHHP